MPSFAEELKINGWVAANSMTGLFCDVLHLSGKRIIYYLKSISHFQQLRNKKNDDWFLIVHFKQCALTDVNTHVDNRSKNLHITSWFTVKPNNLLLAFTKCISHYRMWSDLSFRQKETAKIQFVIAKVKNNPWTPHNKELQ